MTTAQYENKGPADCTTPLDLTNLKEKSIIVTGGSSGLGAAYVRSFIDAGAFVTIADLKPNTEPLPETRVQFIKCDVRNWAEQVEVFKAAIANSPQKSIDIVVANAGVAGPDPLFQPDEGDEPKEPDLKIININFIGVVYTTKLAMHYFIRQPDDSSRDRCLILKSSLAGYMDISGSPSYQSAKFGVRGLMCNLRHAGRFRVNVVAPWFIATPIMSEKVVETLVPQLKSAGSEFAEVGDSVNAVLRVATDKSISGRSLAVVPRSACAQGYLDLDHDDFKEGDIMYQLQSVCLGVTHRRLPAHQQ
ncbi:NAD(P)-binding protein [Glonium stellatum]|uniref:NAD(P)-binding protein n=1 Tax=Glonium stellatum TaxID=574774 RepID=A0A8E2EQ21_9PEZI|nr:NAD(P)-binding protein [Glonium stellatum]